MNKPLRVLVVDDSVMHQDMWKEDFETERLNGVIEIVSAYTIPQAEAEFSRNQEWNLIVMDGCVPGNIMNTDSLVKKILLKYAGPMVVISSFPDVREALAALGCSHQCGKASLCRTIRQILGIS